ncbi:DUF2332 domain-containing protein [Longispora sp. K20-0274]|uniref:DUF2332 family protein n=1 Tax=Longispora sp. K20-0274 TaxID=3088255 RepID=UPI00399B5F5C
MPEPTLIEAFENRAIQMADREPVHAHLCRAVLADPSLAAAVADHGRWGRPNLLFTAVNYLLATTVPDHPLAGHYRAGEPTDDLVDAFRDLVVGHAAEVAALCAGRKARANDPQVAALLRPGLGWAAEAAGDRPLALVELGAAAGLTMFADHYGYRYTLEPQHPARPGGDTVLPGAPELSCAARSRAPGHLDTPLRIAERIGLDLDPIRADDPDAVAWLLAGIGPDLRAARLRVDAGLALAAELKPELRAGDFLDTLPGALADIAPGHLPVVYGANTLCCLPDPGRLVTILAGAGREVVWLTKEMPRHGLALVSDEDPYPDADGLVTAVVFRDGRAVEATVLAEVDGWGTWIEWKPTPVRVRPAA